MMSLPPEVTEPETIELFGRILTKAAMFEVWCSLGGRSANEEEFEQYWAEAQERKRAGGMQ